MSIHTTAVEIGFNQSELLITEGDSTEAIICVEVTSGSLERNITVYMETVMVIESGMSKYGQHILFAL